MILCRSGFQFDEYEWVALAKRGDYGVGVTDGVLVSVGVLLGVGVRVEVGVRVKVGVREGVIVNEGVVVGIAVGASPSRINCPTRFHSSPTKTCTS